MDICNPPSFFALLLFERRLLFGDDIYSSKVGGGS